ncbi:MAG TPA: hypothetical protein ENK85_01120 [Saprospiraceae bacterium]|nr:hypothetical protein [Saprospiraceae bacterium]
MENNQFDNEIRKMLQDLEVPFQDAHWDSMAKRLQETQEPNMPNAVTGFDKSITEKVAFFEVPFDESNWVALRQRLVASAYMKRWILQTKSVEALFLLVLVVFFVNTAPVKQPKPSFHGPVAGVNLPKTPSANKTESAAIISSASESSRDELASNSLATDDGLIRNSKQGAFARTSSPIHPLVIKQADLLEHSPVRLSGDEQKALREVASANTKEMDYLLNPKKLLEYQYTMDLMMPKVVLAEVTSPKLGFSVYGIANVDHVITGIDPTYDVDVPNLWSPGYGGGVALSKSLGRYDLTYGVEYQEVKYFPKPIIRISQGSADLGYAGSGTTTVEVTKVNVPVTLGYRLLQSPKHQLSMEIGMVGAWGKETFEQSTYILGKENPEDESQLRKKMNLTEPQPSAYVQPPTVIHPEPTLYSSRVSPKPKFYAAARANIAYEFKMDCQHAIFAKVSYSHQISKNGIGLPKDKLHSFGLHFGSRVYL